jgi:hypothetical protein
MESDVAIDQVIRQNESKWQKPGVLFVRPGYKSVKGQIKDIPAIVVTVEDKRKGVSARDRVPAKIGPYPTDVRQASPMHLLRASNPDLWAKVADAAPPAEQRPIFPFERNASGALEEPILAAAAAKVAASKPPKNKINYTAPAGVPLNAVTDTIKITCHASPDAGWPTLQTFLQGTEHGLTVAMYEFTAPHIVTNFLANAKKLSLVLDDAPDPTKREQTDDDTHGQLQKGLGKALTFAWALEGGDPHAAAQIFPRAYHIKVIVRDGKAFWLSSGNLNTSNQPNINPIQNLPAAKAALPNSDRDWHVIIENPQLAGIFESYIENDLSIASKNQLPDGGQEAVVASALAARSLPPPPKSKIPVKFFPPHSITAKMTIEPVLTPDNYADKIIPLIRNTKTRFWMQTQYINLPKTIPSLTTETGKDDSILEALVSAIKELIDAGKDVRLILSNNESQDKRELLRQHGITDQFVKIQNRVHNKGMLIDSSIAVVGSQNWSPEGVRSNRDASVIIHNADAAKYWEQIFDHDWQNMTQMSSPD